MVAYGGFLHPFGVCEIWSVCLPGNADRSYLETYCET